MPISYNSDPNKLAEFLAEYHLYATAFGWTDAQMCIRLPLHVSGVARLVELFLGDTTWENVGQELEKTLPIDTSAELHRTLFMRREQKPNESVQQ